jgi:hypothetical protein
MDCTGDRAVKVIGKVHRVRKLGPKVPRRQIEQPKSIATPTPSIRQRKSEG